MKDIRECIQNIQGLVDYLQEQQDNTMNEGLKDIFNYLKTKFKKLVNYLKGFVAKMSGPYWVAVDNDGEILNATTPLTMAQAFADRLINTGNTLVAVGSVASRLTGCKTKPADALKLYGTGNSIGYWRTMLNESQSLKYNSIINEVKMANEDPAAKYNVVDTPLLKKRIKMALTKPNLAPLLIWGAPGIGKTAILRTVLDELPNGGEYSLIVKTLSNETPDNFTLPKYCEIEGQEKATDVPKDWLPVYKPTGNAAKDQELSDACGKGLLFIDELSRATSQVLNVILPLVNERIFNGYHLGKGWTIICASNRMEDEQYGEQANIGNALGNRFAQLYYEPTVKTWRQWAETQDYISPLLLQWLSLPETENMSGGKYFYWDQNDGNDSDQVTKIMCSPRSWTNAMRELAVYADTGKLEGWTLMDLYNEDKDIITLTLNQYIPAEAIDSFMAFLAVLNKVGNFEQFCDAVWHGNGSGAKLDNKSISAVAIPVCQLLVTYMHPDKHFPTAEEFNSLADWLVSQGSDQLVSYITDTLIAVYASELPTDNAALLFVGKPKLLSKPATTRDMFMKSTAMKQWLGKLSSKYGIVVDPETLDGYPDWSEGFMKIAKKYKDIFAQYKMNGMDIL